MKFAADAFSLFLLHMQNLDGFLLAANHALALFHETYRNGVGNPVCGGFISIEHAIQKLNIFVILLKKRTSQNVPQEKHYA